VVEFGAPPRRRRGADTLAGYSGGLGNLKRTRYLPLDRREARKTFERESNRAAIANFLAQRQAFAEKGSCTCKLALIAL